MRFVVIVLGTLLMISCTEIFTTSMLSSLKEDVSDMSVSEIAAYLSSTPLSEISASDLEAAEVKLSASRIELSVSDLDNNLRVEQYIKETQQLIDINMEQADIEGLLSDALSLAEGEDSGDLLDSILADDTRLGNLQTAADYVVDAFKVDPESLTSTELLIGSAGLVSDVLNDSVKADALTAITDTDPADLEAALTAAVDGGGDPVFTAEEISDIKTATQMLDLAQENLGDDFSDLLEGFSF